MPSLMTVLGLVRHMTEMERIYAAWALAGDGPLTFVYGDYTDGGPEWDFDCDASMVDDSLAAWERERAAADAAIAGCASMDAVGTGNRRSLRWNLAKLVQEYARHNGHADIVRELIDGAAGMRATSSNLPDRDRQWWAGYRDQLQAVAEQFRNE